MQNYRQAISGDLDSSTLVANPVDAYHLVNLETTFFVSARSTSEFRVFSKVKRLTIDWEVIERVLEVEANSSRSKCSLEQTLFIVYASDQNPRGAALSLYLKATGTNPLLIV